MQQYPHPHRGMQAWGGGGGWGGRGGAGGARAERPPKPPPQHQVKCPSPPLGPLVPLSGPSKSSPGLPRRTKVFWGCARGGAGPRVQPDPPSTQLLAPVASIQTVGKNPANYSESHAGQSQQTRVPPPSTSVAPRLANYRVQVRGNSVSKASPPPTDTSPSPLSALPRFRAP